MIDKGRWYRRMRWRWLCLELVIMCFIVLIAFTVSLSHLWNRVNVIGRDYRFEQEWLVPAISIACGQGFTTPCAPYPENVSLFLQQKVNSMSPKDLPVEWKRWDNSSFVKTHRYLITSIGLLWRYFGIRWDLLKVYASIMFVITVVATYLGVRAVWGRLPAIIVALLTSNSPALLFLLPSLRDYSKAMFFTLFLAVLVCYLKYFKRTFIVWTFASLLGAIAGFGIGFRQDALVLFMLGSVVILFSSFLRVYTERKWIYLVTIIFYILPFILIGYPILKAIREENGAVSSHSLAQGLAYEVEERILGGESNYRIVYDSNDMLVHSLVMSNARVKGFEEPVDNYLSPSYGDAGRLFFWEVAKRFPADLWMRLISACSNSFSSLYCFDVEQIVNRPEFRQSVGCLVFSNYLIYWDKFVAYLGPWTFIGLILLLGSRNVFQGILLGGFLILLLGYTSILFEFRHIVHLVPVFYALSVLVPFWIFVKLVIFLSKIRKSYERDFQKEIYVFIRNGVWTISILGVGIVGVYIVLRLWQERMLQDTLFALSKLEWERIEIKEEVGTDRVLYQPVKAIFDMDRVKYLPPMEVPFQYLRVDLEVDTWEDVGVINRYNSDYPSLDFSESYDKLIQELLRDSIRGVRKLVHIYFPVFCTATLKPTGEPIFENKVPLEWVRNMWLGVEVKNNGKCRLLSLNRLKQTGGVPLIFTLAVSEDGGQITPKRWRWGWNPKDVKFNLERNTAVFAHMISEFTFGICGEN